MTVVRLSLISLCLLVLPLLGILIDGRSIIPYLEFPPRTRYVEHAPFSWPIFLAMTTVAALAIAPFLLRFIQQWRIHGCCPARAPKPVRFPVWGWLALGINIVSWLIAWTRCDWFAAVQRHTFIPLWYSFIIVVNAATMRRCGSCLLVRQPRIFVILFPVSAVFWWFFEYLNRYVQNWYYVGIEDFGAGRYVFFASISFATVLPAVASVQEWLRTLPIIDRAFSNYPVVVKGWVDKAAWPVLIVAGAGLLLIGVYPDYLYPLIWLSPFFVIISLHRLLLDSTANCALLEKLSENMFSWPLAALVCGFFWELWNTYSLAKWIYSVPFAYRFHIFEMPLLGYAGYLPFGLECAVIVYIVVHSQPHPQGSVLKSSEP